ncbi:lipocalin-like domain-containing protein [Glaciecola sp. KUL10]|uniref:lipocalin-like domain-containing protein n=1 Tax=Glaciecola sp. (strain KUL10) TaxID=2161813 RepID=UPI000D78B5A2|nr:lipocalin-like domain-containing protein [Glaciecola sp. KUL10]GBL04799.1 hypothetical protein KUL10_21130 [Glaciecola sp. KUL10]
MTRNACKLVLSIALLVIVLSAKLVSAQQPMLDPNLVAQSGKKVTEDYQISFPKDHYAHPDFDIEWWYLTSNLEDTQGNQYALQFTLFRFRTGQAENNWDDGQAYMGHASIHAGDQHWFTEKFAKGGVGNAGVTAKPFTAFIDDWLWQADVQPIDDMFPSRLRFSAASTDDVNQSASADLMLDSQQAYVLHGEQGYSIKSGNQQHASYYYSQPFIKVSGSLLLEDNEIEVSGNAWFDHEWTSQLIDQQTVGWDWFSIHLDNGDKLMAFVMRLDGQQDYATGTYIAQNGDQRVLLPHEISINAIRSEKVNGTTIPLEWSLRIPSKNIDIITKTTKDDQFNPARFSYYEGSIQVSGSHKGIGFMELTGY